METPALPPHHQALQDAEHLKLLSIFHYVVGAFTVLLGCLPIFHIVMGVMLLAGGFPSSPGSTPPPAELGWMFVIFGRAGLPGCLGIRRLLFPLGEVARGPAELDVLFRGRLHCLPAGSAGNGAGRLHDSGAATPLGEGDLRAARPASYLKR